MTNVVKFQPLPATKFFTNGLFDEFFNRNVGEFIGNENWTSQPAVNVTENDESFNIEVAAPGFSKPDFSLNVENGQLVVSAKREEKAEENNEKNRFLRREFRFESFKRSFKLPNTVNQDAISAVYENGLLLVTLPKKEEAKPVSKTIQIG
ncbi:MAG: Hsp20/alpha crystallin family protein [Chitinophagales bacterium]|nr:Hsp20/alpha crystallin family protein [Chitinophagales bacterium]